MRIGFSAPRTPARAVAVALSWIVLMAAIALPMSPADAVPDETFADDFDSYSFSGSTGGGDWDGPWVEIGESDGVAAGTIQVRDEPNCLNEPCLVVGRSSGPDAWVEREVDLSGYASANLTFDYKVHWHPPGGGTAELSVSDDGGGNWVTLDSWPLGTTTEDLVGSYDLTPYLAADTIIRFGATDSSSESHMNVDNLVITASGRQGYFDEFPASGWDGSTGSLDWSTSPWVESEGDGWGSGLVQVITNPFCADGDCLRIEGSAVSADHSVVRQVDLTGATFASLFFNYRRENYTSCAIQLDVSDDGGSSWAPLAWYDNNGGDAGQQSEAIDIYSHAAANTQIRFSSDRLCSPGQFFHADNIWVYTDAAPSTNRAPAFDQDLLDRTDSAGEHVAFGAPATDPDGSDTLTYGATGLPDGIAIDPVSGSIVGVLSPNSAGVHAVTITVSDDGIPNLGATDAFTWTINDGEVFYLVAGSGGGAGGDDLLTGFDPGDFDASTNEIDIGAGLGTNSAEGADIDPNTGVLYAAVDDEIGTVDPATGSFTARPSDLGSGNGPQGIVTFDSVNALAFHPSSGELFVVIGRFAEEDLLIKADPATGAHVPGAFGGDDYVPIEGLAFDRNWNTGIDFDPTTGTMYGVTSNLVNTTLITIDPSTGQSTEVGTTRYGTSGLAFDGIGRLWGVHSQFTTHEVFQIDEATGADTNPRPIDNGSQYRAMAIGGTPPPNTAPVFDQDLLDRSDPEGSLIAIASSATDPDVADNLTYSASGLPDGISIDTGSGDITGILTASSSGTHIVTISVADDGAPSLGDTDTFTWTVTEGEPAYLVAAEGGGVSGNEALLTAVDLADSNPATNEMTIGTTTGRTNVEGLAVQPGTNVVFASHNDQIGTIDVVTGLFSALPATAGIGTGSAGLEAFDNIEALSFDPATGDFFAAHRRGGGSEESMLIKIDPATGAHIPNAFGGDDYIEIQRSGDHYHVPGMAHDPTTGVLFIVHLDAIGVDNRELATVNSATGATTTIGSIPDYITGLSFSGDGRLYAITDEVSGGTLYEIDKTDGSVVSSMNVDNTNEYEAIAIAANPVVNQTPVFGQNLLDRADTEGDVISLDSAATDPDGNGISFSASGLPPGLLINPLSGLISGTIDFTAAASSPYDVAITATDDGFPARAATDTFSWTVNEQNRPPVFNQNLLDRSDAEGDVISLDAGAADPDVGDNLTYGATGLPPGLSIDTGSGLITGTIDYTAAAASPYNVTITVTDDGTPNLSAPPDTFAWTVTNTNRAPVIVNPGAQTTPELDPFSIVVTASDPDGTVPSLTDSATLPAWATLTDNGDGTATIAGMPGIGGSGTTTVTITASDGSLSDDAVFDITVTNTNVAPVIVNPGSQPGNEGSPFTAVISASDADGTTVSFTDSGTLPAWATLTDNGDDTATISGTPGYTDAGTTTVTIAASDGDLTDDAVFDIIIENTNRTPVVDPIGDQTVAEGSPLVPVVVSASDPDGTIPALVASGLPAWASFLDNGDGTGTITGTPGYTDAATTAVTVGALDGSLIGTAEFDLIVTNTNRAPVFNPVADQAVAEGSALAPLTVTAIDPDGTFPALAASGLPDWTSFLDNGDGTGTITGTPGYIDAGATTITIYAEDGGTPNLSDTTNFDITVTNTNRAPVLSPIADQIVLEATALTPVDITAVDPDGTVPVLNATGLPGWAGFVDNGNGTGVISGTPGITDTGVSTVTVSATDGSLVDTKTFDITVTQGNLPPIFDHALPDRTDAEGASIAIDASATDPDGDGLAYSAAGLPPGVAIDTATGQIAGTLTYDAAGIYGVTINALDDGTPALLATRQFTWTVTDKNRAPSLAPIPAILGPEQTELAFTAIAVDPDGQAVTYSLAGAPAGASIDPVTGVFTWVPSEAQGESSYAFTVVAADNGTPSLSDTKTVTVTVTEVNLPPVIDAISDQHNEVGDLVDLRVTAADPDVPLNYFTFAASGLPAGLSIHAITGKIIGSISEGAEGTHEVTVTVTDDGEPQRSGEVRFKWLVGGANRPPEMERIADRTVAELSPITIRPAATDPDGDGIRFEIAGAPPGSSFDATTGTFRWIPSEEQGPGTYRLSIIAADDGDPELVAIGVVSITVTEVNSAPTIEPITDRADDAGTAVSVQVAGTDTDIPTNTLTFRASDLPPGLTIDPATGVISGRISATTEDATHYTATVTVTDDGEEPLSASATFTWTVVGGEAQPENFPPSVDPIAAQYSDAGATVSLGVQASDAEPVVFSANGLPEGLTIRPTTGMISGTLADGAVGTHAVVITVADTGEVSLQTSISFTWTVTDREAADQKDDVVVTITDAGPTSDDVSAGDIAGDSRPIRRGLVVMSSAAAATTESMRLPMALLLALLVGFATIGRVGLYPLLWRGERVAGTLGLYDPELNFGLIHPDDGGEQVFVHANAFPRRQRATLATGMRVRYRVLTGDNRANAWGATTEVDDG